MDHIVYPSMLHLDPVECRKWFNLNPDIYTFIKDEPMGKIVAYANTAPKAKKKSSANFKI